MLCHFVSTFKIFVICALIGEFTSSVSHAAEQNSLRPVAVKLALNWKPEPEFGGFYAAHLAALDTKEGLNFDIQPGGAGTPVVQMVAAGQVDFGIASADEVIISRARGGDVVALFASYQTNPQGIMVHPAAGFKSLADLYASEATLAMQKGLPYAMFLSHKFPKAKVKIVPYLGGIQNFMADGKVAQQCFVTSEPLTAKKMKLPVQTFLVAEEGYNPYTAVLITRDEVIKKNPKLVKSVVAAVRAGWRNYLDHPETTNREMSNLNPSMDMDMMKASADSQRALIETSETLKSGLGSMTVQRWQTLAEQLHDLKLISKLPDTAKLFQNP
jgi:NitT/TauT family transport system substrate-binding protein